MKITAFIFEIYLYLFDNKHRDKLNKLMIVRLNFLDIVLVSSTSYKFFTPVLTDGFSLKSELQQIFLDLQDSFKLSSQFP